MNAREVARFDAVQRVGIFDEAMTKLHQLDAFMHNFYKNNAAKLGEWHTASHIERQAKAKKPATPPAKPNP